jgi:hypothetical protein
MNTFAEKVIRFNRELDYAGDLPDGIRIMNPFKENREIESISRAFYEKFYNDQSQRRIILGINPGRLERALQGSRLPIRKDCQMRVAFLLQPQRPMNHLPFSSIR